jgi:hypothetical protein
VKPPKLIVLLTVLVALLFVPTAGANTELVGGTNERQGMGELLVHIVATPEGYRFGHLNAHLRSCRPDLGSRVTGCTWHLTLIRAIHHECPRQVHRSTLEDKALHIYSTESTRTMSLEPPIRYLEVPLPPGAPVDGPVCWYAEIDGFATIYLFADTSFRR